MLNYKVILFVLGQLLFLEAIMLAACCGVGFIYDENTLVDFGIPTFICVSLGLLFHFLGRSKNQGMGRRDAFLIVSTTWLLFSIIGMLPFLLSGIVTRPSVAFFETMSGFTTTGATALNGIDALPHSILFWRSLTHWVGGVGIVFFTIAILPNADAGEQKMFTAESTGLKIGKLHPRVRSTARWIGGLYVFLTLACIVSLYLGGMDTFDAINHGLSTISTGGFSTHQDSIAFFHSARIENILMVFMVLASLNFTVLYLGLFKKHWKEMWKDDELRVFLGIVLTIALIGMLVLYFRDHRTLADAARLSFFHTIAIQSTTGFTTENFMNWDPSTWVFVAFITIVGGCAGSTSGGIKCIRILTIYKVIVREFKRMLHPHAVFPIRISGTLISNGVVRNIFVFITLYIILTALGTTAMMAMGLTMLDSVSCCITCLSNVGPGYGYVVGPLDSWDVFPDAVLWIDSFLMLVGRLEIYSILLPFMPGFWRDN